MEKWDLLDAEGNPTGRTIVRGEPLLPGMYHLVEHIWIVDSKGRLLIQQRNPDLKLMPGVWAANSGSAQAGEESEDAARRELKEELGITDTKIIHVGTLPPTEHTGWEHVAIYAALYDGKVHFPAAEISGVMPFPSTLIDTWLERRPQDFASSFALCWAQVRTMLGE